VEQNKNVSFFILDYPTKLLVLGSGDHNSKSTTSDNWYAGVNEQVLIEPLLHEFEEGFTRRRN
jgi:hypothetical protein